MASDSENFHSSRQPKALESRAQATAEGGRSLVQSDATVADEGRKSPSNRRDLSLVSREFGNETVGVDRLSVSFEVFDYDSKGDNWDSYAERHAQQRHADGSLVSMYSRRVEVEPGVNVFVGVMVHYVKSQLSAVFGKIEFNPSRVVDPHGFGLATVDDTIQAFVRAVVAAGCVLVPVRHDELSSYKIKRIDVAKDFHSVVSPSSIIRGLAPIPRNWARKNLVHADPSRHGAQTLLVGSKSGVVRLYDKFAESKGGVEPGTVRWEVEARQAWALKYGHLRLLSDLPVTGIEPLAQNRWEWSAMGVEVRSVAGVVDVVARLGLSEREATMFLGWLVRQSTAWAWEPSFTTAAKFRRYQRELGVTIGPDSLGSLVYCTRLSWESGTEIIRVLESESE